jgi:transposase-like protein
VAEFCGALHRPDAEASCYRAGSAPGFFRVEGRRERIKRPRVRQRQADGSSAEQHLATYALAHDPATLQRHIVELLMSGTSTRDVGRIGTTGGMSRSHASRFWQEASAEFLDAFRSRPIDRDDWLVLMLDGVHFSKDITAVVAMGICLDGTKHLLDFAIGSSENREVAAEVVRRLVARGFRPMEDHRLLSVLDGSDALAGAVQEAWPDAVMQRCLVHKERNLRARLSRKDWGELAARMKRLREVEGEAAGHEALGDLRRFVDSRNAAALESLDEAGLALIALHCLKMSSRLHVSLLSTNAMENPIRNIRGKTRRVSRWRPETNQAARWIAYALDMA